MEIEILTNWLVTSRDPLASSVTQINCLSGYVVHLLHFVQVSSVTFLLNMAWSCAYHNYNYLYNYYNYHNYSRSIFIQQRYVERIFTGLNGESP